MRTGVMGSSAGTEVTSAAPAGPAPSTVAPAMVAPAAAAAAPPTANMRRLSMLRAP